MTGERIQELLALISPHLLEDERVILIAVDLDCDEAALIATETSEAWVANRLHTALTQLVHIAGLTKEEDKN